MPVPAAALECFERYCAERTPAHLRDEMRMEVTVRGSALTLWDYEPPWREEDGPEWTRHKIAQLRFSAEHLTWTVYWPNRNEAWLRYEALPPTANLARIIEELDRDPFGCFFG